MWIGGFNPLQYMLQTFKPKGQELTQENRARSTFDKAAFELVEVAAQRLRAYQAQLGLESLRRAPDPRVDPTASVSAAQLPEAKGPKRV